MKSFEPFRYSWTFLKKSEEVQNLGIKVLQNFESFWSFKIFQECSLNVSKLISESNFTFSYCLIKIGPKDTQIYSWAFKNRFLKQLFRLRLGWCDSNMPRPKESHLSPPAPNLAHHTTFTLNLKFFNSGNKFYSEIKL